MQKSKVLPQVEGANNHRQLSEKCRGVQLLPFLMVIDSDDLAVANSHVVEITFPGDAIETALGKMNTIVGSGTAKIIVGNMTIRGAPLS